MSLTNTKSLLAKLLASENLTVEHGNYSTASMDVKNRVLRLPIWKEMSGSLYDLMVLHEVGHALYTPEDGWHESASNKGAGYKSFLNVVEDARIERKIKDKYPGGRRAFTDGYLDLMDKDFFGIKGTDVNELGLIDRINLYFKGGFIHDIEFSAEESEFVEKVSNTRTWDDVVRVTDELYEYAKSDEANTDMSDHSSMSWGDGEEGEKGEGEEMDMGMEGNESSDSLEDFMDEMKKRGLEAGDEEKEEDESGGLTAENEGENSDGEGESAGDESAEDGEESDTKSSGGDSEIDGDENSNPSGEGAGRSKSLAEEDKFFTPGPSSVTDRNFREREGELVEDDSVASVDYANMPVANTSKIIVDHKEIHAKIFNHYNSTGERRATDELRDEYKNATKKFVEFRSKNKKTVEYLAKEFEMKKAADAHSRTATANSGIINTSILHTYKYNEHIFKKINVTTDGKNHGLIMVVDWSGSMGNNIKGTIEQLMVLVMFAKRVNIPFEVYLFSDTYPSEIRGNDNYRDNRYPEWTHKDGGKNDDLMINPYHLLNVFSGRMRANEIHQAYINMTAIATAYDRDYHGYYRYRTCPSELNLGGTPLNDSLLTMHTLLPEFKAKNNVQVVNLIYLTDGDSAGGEYVWNRRTVEKKNHSGETVMVNEEARNLRMGYSWRRSSSKEKVFIRDTKTKKEYLMENSNSNSFSRNAMTNTLVKVLRDAHGVNVVNFFIIPKINRHQVSEFVDRTDEDRMKTTEKLHSLWRKEGHLIGKDYGGWSELYLIRGGKALDVVETEFKVSEDAKKGEIKRAFSKMNKNKLKNRLLLSKFVDMVAA
tara:strand:- start:98 stop:2566 length:2469 start_codon:yes stop_codon:yes gene_type:complete